jgi:exosome complex RNA-binding protein Rrp4
MSQIRRQAGYAKDEMFRLALNEHYRDKYFVQKAFDVAELLYCTVDSFFLSSVEKLSIRPTQLIRQREGHIVHLILFRGPKMSHHFIERSENVGGP